MAEAEQKPPGDAEMSTEESKPAEVKPHIFRYKAPWVVYGLSWSQRADEQFRLAVGSFIEEYTNKVEIVQLNEETQKVQKVASFDHPYPTTKIMWFPDSSNSNPDLLATTGDYFRVWEVREGRTTKMKCLLDNNKNSEFCAPLTSFDWNRKDTSIVGTSSIDTTCTIWDLTAQQVKTQLIAHDKEVYDIAFAQDVNTFCSVGADGSVRHFDLRSLDHSTILYETSDLTPLLRVSWNMQDPNYLACVVMDSAKIIVLDIRIPSLPVAELDGHVACLNAIDWAPHSGCHIGSAADDAHAFIWDLSALPKSVEEPVLAYQAPGPINALHWSKSQTDWMAIAVDETVELLHV